jgi:hypothetical protein
MARAIPAQSQCKNRFSGKGMKSDVDAVVKRALDNGEGSLSKWG